MPIKRLETDPRTAAEKAADVAVLAAHDAGTALRVSPAREAAIVKALMRNYQARRNAAAAIGKQLGDLRKARGMSQEQLAHRVGTRKSNISRLESGRYGGLSIERFLATLEALDAGPFESRRSSTVLVVESTFSRFASAADCLEVIPR